MIRVIGTAGHVDHGKSTLIEALTGTHPDRLKEERDRQMTIDLGFAWFTLAGGDEVGIVDVPGHRDFIENMLAGVGGIDAALFVIAADEGIMPQTREHLTILNLLRIPVAVIALTKLDQVYDPEWLDLVEEEIYQFSRGTVLENAPIVPVSAKTGVGMDVLKDTLEQKLLELPTRQPTGIARLPVDRVFTIAGFGTVVTGTLFDGSLNVGQDVQVYPGELTGKIRGLQTHKHKEEMALPGSRTALNVSGLDSRMINRGDVISLPGRFKSTHLIDARIELLADANFELKHQSEIKLFIGTSEILSRVRVLGQEFINPGEPGWVQLELQSETIAVKGDRFILRRPSPAETIGGGIVVNAIPGKRHKRFDEKVINQLEMYLKGSPEDLLLDVCRAKGALSFQDLLKEAGNESENWFETGMHLWNDGRLISLDPTFEGDINNNRNTVVASTAWVETVTGNTLEELEAFHKKYPYRPGMPKEALKSKSGLSGPVFNGLLKRWLLTKKVKENKIFLSQFEFIPSFDRKQQNQIDALLKRFKESAYVPPTVKECLDGVGADLYRALVENEILMEVSSEVVFGIQEYGEMVSFVKAAAGTESGLSVAQFRDHFSTSRRYALALLEHLDSIGVTRRDGDFRKLKTQTLKTQNS